MEREEFKRRIRNKFIIFDTNILIKALQNMGAFKDLLDFLREANCEIVNYELVNFEFTRNDYLPEFIDAKQEFVKKISATLLPHQPKIISDALEISKIYSFKGIRKGGISLTDCCLAALLKEYSGKLYLATSNHSDFPLVIFDRDYILPIESGNDIFTLAFYGFSEEKWKKVKMEAGNNGGR